LINLIAGRPIVNNQSDRRTVPLVDLKAGFDPIRDEIMSALECVFSGMDLNIGPQCRAFEEEFASYCGVKYAVGVGSGTEAIQFALTACGVSEGDEVITAPNTFFATAEAVVAAGSRPVFADIEPLSYTISPEDIERRITCKTKAIVPVHMFGQPADMNPILELAGKYGLSVVEDACQAHGAGYTGAKAGSLGDAGCFSFYFTKNLGGYGEGGMVTTNSGEIAEKIKLLRNHGHKSKYEHSIFGYNGRLDEVQAAILRVKLKYLDEYVKKRRAAAQRYAELLKEIPLTLPEEAPERDHTYHLYVVRSSKRDALQTYLHDHGVNTGIHYRIPIHLQEAARPFGYKQGDFPAAESACLEILSLPMYPELDEDSQVYIADIIRAFYDGR
jgi:dTDP-4-amino-4,6-dideoxygalactose transaminase